MKRSIYTHLEKWSSSSDRKVLLLRGARQVGKTYAVRHFSRTFDSFLEVNFEESQEIAPFFDGSLNPDGIVQKLENYFGTKIVPGKTLLFFDEIQACPNALRSLRFFYEKIPHLHVVACGSMLEFALENIPSHGVGRITSLFMFPMTFCEFLQAMGEETLWNEIKNSSVSVPLAAPFHIRLVEHLKTYMTIGGMPETVKKFVKTGNIELCQNVLNDLLRTFKDDFSKYNKRVPTSRLNDVFESIVFQAGNKFKYSKVCHDVESKSIKSALDLLVLAGLAYRIYHSDARGLPLGAQINPKRFKTVLLDIGLHQRVLGLDLTQIMVTNDFDVINKGAIAEAFVAQEIRGGSDPSNPRNIYYWHREARQSNAEVDYVIQHGSDVLPVEVKSGGRGSMQSMHMFVKERSINTAIRTSLENFGTINNIDIVPLYALASYLY